MDTRVVQYEVRAVINGEQWVWDTPPPNADGESDPQRLLSPREQRGSYEGGSLMSFGDACRVRRDLLSAQPALNIRLYEID